MYDQSYTNLLISKNPIRQFIRKHFYIHNLLKFIDGKTLDFGCGVGEVLKFLPPGSVGMDINKSSVDFCLSQNLKALIYDSLTDKYNFIFVKTNLYQTFLMNHVLEHLPKPKKTLEKILESARKKKIKRVVIVVPCRKGYESDRTHVEYIDQHFFSHIKKNGYNIIYQKYYPINNALIGNFLRYQEMIIVLEKS